MRFLVILFVLGLPFLILAQSPLLLPADTLAKDPFESEAFPLTPSELGPAPIFPFTPLKPVGVQWLREIIPRPYVERQTKVLDLLDSIILSPYNAAPLQAEDAYLKRIRLLRGANAYSYMMGSNLKPSSIEFMRNKLAREASYVDRLVWPSGHCQSIALFAGSPYGPKAFKLGPSVLLSEETFDYLVGIYPPSRGWLLGQEGYDKDSLLQWKQATNRRAPDGGLMRIYRDFGTMNRDFAAEFSAKLNPEEAPTPHLQGEVAYLKKMLTEVAEGELEIISPERSELDTLPTFSENQPKGYAGPQYFTLLHADAEAWLAAFRRVEDTVAERKGLIKEMIADLERPIELSSLDSTYAHYAATRKIHPSLGNMENWLEGLEYKRKLVLGELWELAMQPETYGQFWYTYYLHFKFSPLVDRLWFLFPETRLDYRFQEYEILVNPYFRETIFFGRTSEDLSGINGAFYGADSYAMEQVMPALAAKIELLWDKPIGKLPAWIEEDHELFLEILTQVQAGEWLLFNVEYI